MRLRFIISHDESNLSLEIKEPDAWRDSILKLERHEEFHSLIEYFEGSFIFYGDNGQVNGGANEIREIVKDYGIDTTIIIQISITFDEINFSEVFNGQLGIPDMEEMPNNKIRIPIIRDDRWAKFISRLETPVNIQSITDLDGVITDNANKINLRLSSQKIKYQTNGKVGISTFYGPFATPFDLKQYIQVDWDQYELDEVITKYTYPVAFNSETPFEKYSVVYAGEYYFKVRIYLTNFGVIIGGGGTVTFDGWYDLDGVSGALIEMKLLVNGQSSGLTFTVTNLGVDGTDGHTRYDLEGTLILNANDKISIFGEVLYGTFFPFLLGSDTSDTGQQGFNILTAGEPMPPNFPSGLTEDNELTIIALTTFPETNAESFLIHDVAGYIIDRITGEIGIFYSELLGSQLTQYRQYLNNGCAWKYSLTKGLQLRQYSLNEKPFFQSFMQWWKGANPILNLSLGYDTVQVPHVVDVSPDVNLIEPLADWSDSPGAGWDYISFGHPFVSVNGNGGIEQYTVGEAVFNEDQPYEFDVALRIQITGSSTPEATVTYAILDSVFNELATREFAYVGAGDKYETFILIPSGIGAYFGVKIVNNTPVDTKNFEVILAFTEDAPVIYTEENVIRIEEKAYQYDDSNGTSIDFSFVRDITKRFDNDRIWNKVSIGYSRWEAEDISGIDDPQTKKVYATRFKKAGKGIDLYSDFIGASLLSEQARRTSREKSKDYKYDNETFIIALNELPQDESPDTSPDILIFIPELDENFISVDGLQSSETRYNLAITPAHNFLRWQSYLQGALQSYPDSAFTFASGEGNYDMVSTMAEGCLGDDNGGVELDEKGDIQVTPEYLFLPELYELTVPMDWNDYQLIRNSRRKPIGVSLSDSGHVSMFIKTLDFKPAKGQCTILAWGKTYLDLAVYEDTTPMQECQTGVSPSVEECENAITDEFGEPLTDEFGECIWEESGEGSGLSDGIALDFPLDSPF